MEALVKIIQWFMDFIRIQCNLTEHVGPWGIVFRKSFASENYETLEFS